MGRRGPAGKDDFSRAGSPGVETAPGLPAQGVTLRYEGEPPALTQDPLPDSAVVFDSNRLPMMAYTTKAVRKPQITVDHCAAL